MSERLFRSVGSEGLVVPDRHLKESEKKNWDGCVLYASQKKKISYLINPEVLHLKLFNTSSFFQGNQLHLSLSYNRGHKEKKQQPMDRLDGSCDALRCTGLLCGCGWTRGGFLFFFLLDHWVWSSNPGPEKARTLQALKSLCGALASSTTGFMIFALILFFMPK